MKHSLKAVVLVSVCVAVTCVFLFWSSATALDQGAAVQRPGTILLDSLVEQYGVVTFNHEVHTFIAEGCGDCHHVHNTERSQSCSSCHALEPSVFKEAVVSAFISCRMCHGEYDPETPSMPGLKVAYHKACFKCHVGIGELGRSPKACAEKCHARGQ